MEAIPLNYRKRLMKVIRELEDINDTMISCVVNLGMSGELKEVDALFEVGDALNLKRSDFADLPDRNVQITLAACDMIEDTISSLMNLNNITQAKLEQDLQDEIDSRDGLPF